MLVQNTLFKGQINPNLFGERKKHILVNHTLNLLVWLSLHERAIQFNLWKNKLDPNSLNKHKLLNFIIYYRL